MSRIPCAVLGATGMVGQRFVERLQDHPGFELEAVYGSDRSAGKRYRDAVDWVLQQPLGDEAGDLPVRSLDDGVSREVPLLFSALPGGVAGPVETRSADAGHFVFSNARDHRMDPDVPLLIPEVNPDDIDLARDQDRDGAIVVNGNCSGIILTLALAPLHRAFGVKEAHVTTMQAISGAGHPRRSRLDVDGNVIPYIAGEEDKLEREPQKTLHADFPIHATATRVPVRDGHLESVHVRLHGPASPEAVQAALADFHGPAGVQRLPSAPERPIHVLSDPDRPQPRMDLDLEDGMAISVGRLRVSGDSARFLVLGDNTVRGAAGQSILNAEYAHGAGLFD